MFKTIAIIMLFMSALFLLFENGDSDKKNVSQNEISDLTGSQTDSLSIFNGKNFEGWTGNFDNWNIENEMIAGSTLDAMVNESSWITTKAIYSDFELTVWAKIIGDQNRNSGVYYRGEWQINDEGKSVVGYEFDVGGWWEDDENFWGELHDPFRRDLWVSPGKELIDLTYKEKDWNHIRIRAQGNRIQHWLNGTQMVDWYESDSTIQKKGFIALQMHSETKFKVLYRDFKITKL